MAGVDNKEKDILTELHLSGRELLKQTINVLEASSLELSFDQIEDIVNNKMKRVKYKIPNMRQEIESTTREQREIMHYYKRLQVLFYKAYKVYYSAVMDFDRLSLKGANLMEEVIHLELQRKLKEASNKLNNLNQRLDKKETTEYSNTIKKDILEVLEIIKDLTEENEKISEMIEWKKKEKALLGTNLMLAYALDSTTKIEAIVKLFEVICKRHKLRQKIEDSTLVISSYNEVVSRKKEFLDTIKTFIEEETQRVTEMNIRYNKELKGKPLAKPPSAEVIEKVLEAYEERKDKLYLNYKKTNRLAKARIEIYLDDQVKAGRDNFDTIDIEQDLIDDLKAIFMNETEVFEVYSL